MIRLKPSAQPCYYLYHTVSPLCFQTGDVFAATDFSHSVIEILCKSMRFFSIHQIFLSFLSKCPLRQRSISACRQRGARFCVCASRCLIPLIPPFQRYFSIGGMARQYHSCDKRKPSGKSFFRRQNACVKSACADRQPHRVSENDANRFFIVVRVF